MTLKEEITKREISFLTLRSCFKQDNLVTVVKHLTSFSLNMQHPLVNKLRCDL